ncbi:fimbrial biogenesis chaperone [Erwinia sp. LJJL01]|uniref:fimbrial biogenesis chaperone n=1 Tax=Erwinia sp. LJJL01 TaxID=3391839 RepID=UPI001061E7B2
MLTKNKFIHGIFPLMLLAIFALPATAAVMINKTRIIYNAKDKSASATLSNITKDNYAVQVWVNGASDRSDEQVPFIATPALARVGPGEDQIVKIIALSASSLPVDRESVFYFNAQEIPALDKNRSENKLTIAVRTRIKLFYRPTGLPGTAEGAISQIGWQRVDRDGKSWLRATNNTPWHISFSTISFIHAGRTSTVNDADMLAPFSHQDYLLPGHDMGQQGKVSFTTINDYGGIKQQPDISLH